MRFRNNWRVDAALALGAAVVGVGGQFNCAVAQTAPAAAPSQETETTIEPVVVTANRRSENAQRVPIAVVAITGDSAEAHGVINVEALGNSVPGLTFTRQTVTATPFLRGVGSPTGEVGDEGSIAFYVDDVYLPQGGNALANFNSVERIEVEKGPQGTLFGRNASGGVIQVFTKNPTAAPELDVKAGYGNYQSSSGSLYATGAITPIMNANISLYGGYQHQGWGRNLTTGNEVYQTRYYGGRIKFLLEPNARTTALLTVDFDNTVSSEGFYHPAPGTVTAGFEPYTGGFYDNYDHTDPHGGNKQSGASLKVTEDVDWAKAVSISAYRFSKQTEIIDESGGPVNLATVEIGGGPDTTITQEFQLLSAESSKISWITGLFFMSDVAGYNPLKLSGAFFPPYAASYAFQTTRSYAGFGQGTFTILPDTHLTAGLRYTEDKRRLDAKYDPGTDVEGVSPNSPQFLSSSKLTERVSLDHQFTDDIMAYIAFNRGFKSATFNPIVLPGAPISAPVKPETLDDYSAGMKSEFLDHRLRINAEAFYYKYKNIQINQLVLGTSVLSNAAAATIKGIDLDVTVVPIDHLTLSASIEGLHGRYDSFPEGLFWTYNPGCGGGLPFSNCSTTANLAGNKTINTPPFSANLTADYVQPTKIGDFDFNLAYNRGGNYFFDPDNGKGQLDPSLDKQPTLNIVNLTISWTAPGGMYDVRAWGRNITGQKYISYGEETTFLTQWAPSPPATYGVDFAVHFK